MFRLEIEVYNPPELTGIYFLTNEPVPLKLTITNPLL